GAAGFDGRAGNAVVPANLLRIYCGVVIPSWTETRGFPAESIPNGGRHRSILALKSRHRKTRRLGRHNLHGFRVYPKKITAFDQAGDVYVTGAHAFRRSRQGRLVRAEGRLVRISTRPQRRRASFEEKSQD